MKSTALRHPFFVRSCLTLIMCSGIAACGEGAPSAGGTPALPASIAAVQGVSNVEYTVVNLAENGFADQNSISPQGKVIFNTINFLGANTTGASRYSSSYYDGTRIYSVIDTVGAVSAVNDAGQVVGLRLSNNMLRQFIWTVGGGAVDLLPEATTTGLTIDINAAGEVAFQIENPQQLSR